MVELGISQNLTLVHKNDRDFHEYHSLRNDDCKFSKLNGLSDFSRASNCQNNDYFERDGIWYDQIMTDSIYPSVNESVVPLMSLCHTPYKSRRHFNCESQFETSTNLLSCSSLSDEVRSLNANVHQSFLKLSSILSPNKSQGFVYEDGYELKGVDQFERQQRKRLRDDNSSLEEELSGKKLKVNEIAKKYDYGERNYNCNIQVEKSNFRNLDSCGDNVKIIRTKEDLKDDERGIVPLRSSGVEVHCGLPNSFMKFDVFDYGHKPVDVSNLSIVEPVVCKDKNGESEPLVEKGLCGNLCDNETTEEKSNHKVSVNHQNWKLISLDCPRRVKISNKEIDLERCSTKDPRIEHLFV